MEIGKKQSDGNILQTARFRSKILSEIRSFFVKRGFLEVETPILLSSVIPEAHLEYFETEATDKKGGKKRVFLAASPEASIKKLIAKGLKDCFEITKSFRNKDTGSPQHALEFTILEWYRVKATYKDLMKDCEELVFFLFKKLKEEEMLVGKKEVKKDGVIEYQGKGIDLRPPWTRMSMRDAFKKYCGVSLDDLRRAEELKKTAKKKGYQIEKNNTWEEIFNQIFLNEIEPAIKKTAKPVILYDYPAPLASLARLKKEERGYAERFELYIAGLELANGFSELADAKAQKKRFEKEKKRIKSKNKPMPIVDRSFVNALKHLPCCAGIALGIDRLMMLFSDKNNIRDVLLFPDQVL